MPVRTWGSARRPIWSRTVAGSSVSPARGSTATSARHTTTATASTDHIATCQLDSSAIILPIEVDSTMATEKAP